jgi:hypothetical protein
MPLRNGTTNPSPTAFGSARRNASFNCVFVTVIRHASTGFSRWVAARAETWKSPKQPALDSEAAVSNRTRCAFARQNLYRAPFPRQQRSQKPADPAGPEDRHSQSRRRHQRMVACRIRVPGRGMALASSLSAPSDRPSGAGFCWILAGRAPDASALRFAALGGHNRERESPPAEGSNHAGFFLIPSFQRKARKFGVPVTVDTAGNLWM